VLYKENAETLTATTNINVDNTTANPAINPAGLAQVLNDHHRIQRSMDIPLFYACRDKDTVLPHILIERVKDAAAITNWDEAWKIQELKMCSHD